MEASLSRVGLLLDRSTVDGDIESGSMPAGDWSGKAVLDVGCYDGEHLMRPAFSRCSVRCGVDTDVQAILKGRGVYPQVDLDIAPAEQMPFTNGTFDLVRSNVSLPYTDLPIAFSEIHRVTKSGGLLHVTMHDWRHQWAFFWAAVKGLHIKSIIDHGYIAVHSLSVAWLGQCFRRPYGNRQYVSFQTRSRLRKLAEAAGFSNVVIWRTHKHIVVQGRKP